jgi:hypothetical protein
MLSHDEFAEAKQRAGLRPYQAEGLKESHHNRCKDFGHEGGSLSVFPCDGAYCFKCHCHGDSGPGGDVIDFFALMHKIDDSTKDGKRKAARQFMKEYGNGKPAAKAASKEDPLEPYSVRLYAREYVDLPESWLREVCGLTDGIHITGKGGKMLCSLTPWQDGVVQKRFANGKLTNGKGAGLYVPDAGGFEERDYIFFTEGASNTQVLTFAGQPAFGTPQCSVKPEFASHPLLQPSTAIYDVKQGAPDSQYTLSAAAPDTIYAIQDPPHVDKHGIIDDKEDSGKKYVQKIANLFPNKKVYAVKFWTLNGNRVEDQKDAVALWQFTAAMYVSSEAYENADARIISARLNGSPISEEDLAIIASYEERRSNFQWLLHGAVNEAELVEPEKPLTWADPGDLTPNDLLPVLPFKLEYLPASFVPMAEDVSVRLNVPLDFSGVYAIASLAGAVGERARVQPKRNDPFTKPLNTWGGLVDDSGAKKTPVFKIFTAALNAVDAEWHAQYVKAHRTWEKAQEEKEPGDEPEPQPRVLIVNWATAAKFHELTTHNPSGILTAADELSGWLADMELEYQKSAKEFYMTCWSGGPFKWSTIKRGDKRSENSLMSIFGNFVPRKLAAFLAKNSELVDGLVQRMQLLVQPDRKPFQSTDMAENTEARERYETVIKRLANLDFQSILVRFAPDAQPMYAEWEQEVEDRRSKETVPAKRSHLAKYPALMPTLAALCELADYFAENAAPPPSGELLIDVAHTERAIELCRYLLSHLDRIYGSMPQPWHPAIGLLRDRLRSGGLGGAFTIRELQRKEWSGLKNMDHVREALMFMEKRDWIRPVQPAHNPKGGAPPEQYLVNPAVWNALSKGE